MKENNKKLKEIIQSIRETNFITIEQFNLLKEKFSILPGGFSENKENSYENQIIIIKALIYMNENKNVNFYEDYKKHPSDKIKKIFKIKTQSNEIEKNLIVINKDILRCIFQFWEKENIENKLEQFKNEIEGFFGENENKHIYSYYQGYLDFCLFFYHLFNKNEKKLLEKKEENQKFYLKAIKIFTELYLKDYISSKESLGKEEDVMLQNSVSLLADIINLIDNKVGKILKDDSTPLYFCMSWVITLFSHEIHDFNVLRRIMDYLLFHEPIIVYVLTSIIIVKFIQLKIKDISSAEKEDIYLAIKRIDLNLVDFNSIIIECEKFTNNNFNDILLIQKKNHNLLYLICDHNFRGTENIIYLYHQKKLPIRVISGKENSFLLSYKFVFILFLVWLFTLFFFQKDKKKF